MANSIEHRYTKIPVVRNLGRQPLAVYRWLLHWLVLLIIPALYLLILTPLIIVISVRALLLSKKQLMNTSSQSGHSFSNPLTWEELISSDS